MAEPRVADAPGDPFALAPEGLAQLLDALKAAGFWLLGPRIRSGAIVYDAIDGIADLPAGWTDRQEKATYRLERRPDQALFGHVVGPYAWRRFLQPPEERLWTVRRTDGDGGLAVEPEPLPTEKLALIGVRPCDLAALAIHDRVFAGGPVADLRYAARRRDAFVLAVDCTEPGGTCFCASTGTGPAAGGGFDLALTELVGPGGHRFVGRVGTPRGAEVLAKVDRRPATAAEVAEAARRVEAAGDRMGRRMAGEGVRELLLDNPEHPRWADVAARCLACGNCTLVCPTCFCTTVVDHTDLLGQTAERRRVWDSCFSLDHSFLHGGSVRNSVEARYRQWLTHKLATWVDQFGTSGCVGCGRCITWCPVGIDLTEEVRALQEAGSPVAAVGGRRA